MEQWYLYCKKADFAGISERFHISPVLARILRNRDVITDAQIESFLHPDVAHLYDPFLLKGMAEGIALLRNAIEQEARIRIMGDYDVDGVCSSYILKTFLTACGAQADIRLPDRVSEGYGMNPEMVREAARDHIGLIITCDNGISSVEAVEVARDLGIRVLITDHHEAPEVLPAADVIIDPKQPGCSYPFRELCGAAVAYKVVTALDRSLGLHEEELLDDLLAYAGMATITDIVPLLDENRIFASEGILRLRKTTNPGLNALMREREIEKEQLNASHIGFVLGPCINSAGRLKHAELAIRLLEETEPEKAAQVARELSQLNERRKDLTVTQMQLAVERLSTLSEQQETVERVLALYLPEAHESVAGIIAGRIKDEFHRPAMIITPSEDGLKGSGRSIGAYNMIDALKQHADLFVKYGGHAKACGFTLKQNGSNEETVAKLSEILNRSCTLTEQDLVHKIWIDVALPFTYLSEAFVEELDRLEPFGLGNERPIFAQKGLTVLSAAIIGKRSNALKMKLEDSGGCVMEGIMFGEEEKLRNLYDQAVSAEQISILYYPRINEFRGMRTIQVLIQSLQVTQ